jgi:hypothetical protein
MAAIQNQDIKRTAQKPVERADSLRVWERCAQAAKYASLAAYSDEIE